jgi:hypothetical protein
VPVRIAIEKVPPGVPLASGLTVTVRNGNEGESAPRCQEMRADLEASILGLFREASARPGCIPTPS